MNCCHMQGLEDLFNEKNVAQEVIHYRARGPAGTTRWLVEAIKARGVQGMALLDIGGGVGAIQHALLGAGAASALGVDASRAYLNAARAEAERRGLADRTRFVHGNFVQAAAQVPPADVVTLDRVICCYPDMEQLVEQSAARAGRLYGVVYPRDAWWTRAGVKVLNFFFRLQKNPFRTFVHPAARVEALVQQHGLRRVFLRRTLVWQVALYERSQPAAGN